MWDEVKKAKAENRRELVLTGKNLKAKIEESNELDENIFDLINLNLLDLSNCNLITKLSKSTVYNFVIDFHFLRKCLTAHSRSCHMEQRFDRPRFSKTNM